MRLVLGLAILFACAWLPLPVYANNTLEDRSIEAINAIEGRDAERVAATIAPNFLAIGSRGNLSDGEELVRSLRNWPFERWPAPSRSWTNVQLV